MTVGQRAARMLIDLINGVCTPRSVVVPAEMVIRQSSRRSVRPGE